jgi:hypothetical protein
MKRHAKQYPMDGHTLRIQKLMERPITNAAELERWAKEDPKMRPETLKAAMP